VQHALSSSYETVIFAGYIQWLTEGCSSSSRSSNGGGGTSSSPCSAGSGACTECYILADKAVLRLQFMLLAVYTQAICQEAPSSSSRHNSSQQSPPQQVDPPAATDSAPTQPRSLLQLSEELWTVCWQHNPQQQQQQQQQQQSLACLQLLADTLQSEPGLKHLGPPANRLQKLVEHAAVSLDAAVHELTPPSTTDQQDLGSSSSSSSTGGGADSGSSSSSSSSSEHQELHQLLQQSSWVLLPLF